MIEIAEFLHYGTIACAVGMSAFGVAIGEGITSSAALQAMDTQPSAKGDISKITMFCVALIETAAVMGLTMSLFLLGAEGHTAHYTGIAELGILFAICLPGLVIGLVSAMPARAACLALARQPFFTQKIFRFTLIAQAMIQAPVIFGFIIAMFIKAQAQDVTTLSESIRLVASGLCIGLGSIGPALGMAIFTRNACEGLGVNRNAYNKIFSFTLISGALIETSMIFSLIISIKLTTTSTLESSSPLLTSIALLSAALCTGLGSIGPGISSGRTSGAACQQIAVKPELHNILSFASMANQSIIDTCALYAVILSLLLILWS